MVGKANGRVSLMCWIWWEDMPFEEPEENAFAGHELV